MNNQQPPMSHLHKGETHPCKIHHALIWCSNGVRKFLRDRRCGVLKHPIVEHVLHALH